MGKVEVVIVWSEAHSKTWWSSQENLLMTSICQNYFVALRKNHINLHKKPTIHFKAGIVVFWKWFILFRFCESMKQNITQYYWWFLRHLTACSARTAFCMCVHVCVLVLHPFMFHSGRGSEQDLCSKCKSKWNNFIIVLWTTISAIWGSNMKIVI